MSSVAVSSLSEHVQLAVTQREELGVVICSTTETSTSSLSVFIVKRVPGSMQVFSSRGLIKQLLLFFCFFQLGSSATHTAVSMWV